MKTKHFVLIFIGVIILGGVISRQIYNPDKNKKETREMVSKYDIYKFAKKSITATLKAPSTAKFPDYNDEGVNIVIADSTNIVVSGYVDAQNSFGAMLRSRYIVALSIKGGMLHVESIDFDDGN